MKKREFSYDYLRVFAMIMVIVIHVSNVYSRYYGFIDNNSFMFSLLYNTIARISVPIFFLISGSLLVDREFNKTKYFKRIIKYVVIIIVWDILYLIWEYFILGNTYSGYLKLLYEPFRAHLWFLYTILLLYIIQPLLKLFIDHTGKTIKIICLILWILLSSFSIMNSLGSLMTQVCYVGYFIFGKYLYEYIKKNDLKKYNYIFIIIFIISMICSLYLNYYASIKFDSFFNLFFAYRTPFIIFGSISFFILIYNYFHDREPSKVISTLSECSLGVYLIHGMFLDLTGIVFDYSMFNAGIGIPFFTLLIFAGSISSVYLLRQLKIFRYIM